MHFFHIDLSPLLKKVLHNNLRKKKYIYFPFYYIDLKYHVIYINNIILILSRTAMGQQTEKEDLNNY